MRVVHQLSLALVGWFRDIYSLSVCVCVCFLPTASCLLVGDVIPDPAVFLQPKVRVGSCNMIPDDVIVRGLISDFRLFLRE